MVTKGYVGSSVTALPLKPQNQEACRPSFVYGCRFVVRLLPHYVTNRHRSVSVLVYYMRINGCVVRTPVNNSFNASTAEAVDTYTIDCQPIGLTVPKKAFRNVRLEHITFTLCTYNQLDYGRWEA